jgi:hypothetical protein
MPRLRIASTDASLSGLQADLLLQRLLAASSFFRACGQDSQAIERRTEIGGDFVSETHDIYIRAHVAPVTEPVAEKPPVASDKDHPKWADWALCWDSETRIDLKQGLTFGVWRLCKLVGTSYILEEEGIFHADNLPAHERKILEDYVNTHPSDAVGFPPQFPLLSCSEFIRRVFYRWAHKGALICGLNLPFDCTRIAKEWSEGRKNE